jgi:hypothetical protein
MKHGPKRPKGFSFEESERCLNFGLFGFVLLPMSSPQMFWVTPHFYPITFGQSSSFCSRIISELKGRLPIFQVNLLLWGACKVSMFFCLWWANQNGLWQMVWYGKLIKAVLVWHNEIRVWHLHISIAKTLATDYFPCNIHLCSFL